MRKLKLELERLEVDTFLTSGEAPWQGTVDARSDYETEPEPVAETEAEGCIITAPPPPPPPKTWPPQWTCDTCYRTCVTGCSCQTTPCTTCT